MNRLKEPSARRYWDRGPSPGLRLADSSGEFDDACVDAVADSERVDGCSGNQQTRHPLGTVSTDDLDPVRIEQNGGDDVAVVRRRHVGNSARPRERVGSEVGVSGPLEDGAARRPVPGAPQDDGVAREQFDADLLRDAPLITT